MKIPIKPRLKTCFVQKTIPPDTIFLLSEHSQFVFQDEAYVQIVPLLDGHHTISDILKTISPQKLFLVLNHLQQIGCIVEANERILPPYVEYWDLLDADPEHLEHLMKKISLTLITTGKVDSYPLKQSLEKNGFQISSNGDFLVVAVEDYLDSELEEINRQNLAQNRPWILVKPEGMILWIGPLFRPGMTACWRCLAHRLETNRQVERFIKNRSKAPVSFKRSRCKLPAATSSGANLAVIEITKALAAKPGKGLENKVLTLDLLTLEFQEHIVVKRPQCKICGNIEILEPQPISLKLCRKVSPVSNYGHRSATPEETFQRYQHLISPISGIITSFLPRESNAYGRSYNYLAGHYFPILRDDVTLLRVNLITRSGGYGHTAMEAKTSTLCESIERYSGIYWGDEKTIQSSYKNLAPHAFHIRDLALFSEEQYLHREEWNKINISDQQYIPEPLEDDTPIAWSPAWSLTEKKFKYLPTAYCFYGYRDEGTFFCVCDSNGCAAGNTLEEAILQGFLELVERDAVAIWWYNRLKRPAVDAASFGIPYWEEMENLYTKKLERDLHVLDISSDLNIPTFVVVSRRLNHPIEDIIVGFGSHLDSKTALMRAMKEANQYIPALSIRSEEGNTIYQLTRPETIEWWKTATYQKHPYLVPDDRIRPKTIDDFPSLASDDLMEDVNRSVAIAHEKNLEVLVVNQTRPDIGLPVVKVVVPGLRHFWRRLAPGRLYDVPVSMKWLDKPLLPMELNPIACFV